MWWFNSWIINFIWCMQIKNVLSREKYINFCFYIVKKLKKGMWNIMKNNNTTKESKDLVTKTKLKLWKKIVITILIFMLLAIIAFVTYEKATVNNTYYIGEKNLQIPVFV